MAGGSRLSCGRDFHFSPDINLTVNEGCKAGFDFVCVPLVNPRFKREFVEGPAKERPGAWTRSDMLLTSQDWGSLIVAKISAWLQPDSTQEYIRKNSERAMKQELLFASHLGVPAILIPLTGPNCANLASIINRHILGGHNHQFWIHVPMMAPAENCDDVIEGGAGDYSHQWKNDTWKWWNTLRTLCDSSKRLGIALEVSPDMPPQKVLDRWYGEPIKVLILPTSIFLTNKNGFPVLARGHQTILKKLFKDNFSYFTDSSVELAAELMETEIMLLDQHDIQLIVTGTNRHRDKGMKFYQQYLDYIWQNQDPPDNVSQFAKGYEDYLQCPLQPLMDNLESQTYEVFEKDPVKYSQYQKAIYYALQDRVLPQDRDTTVTTVMVLGAGRGPLVTASLQAAEKADRKIHVYAVEKNPNAVITLQNLKYEMWGEQVTVVPGDMRFWEAPEKADIIVSELLGSFGDNELSPECLDGAQKFLKDDGISIPREYTSFVAPLSSSKLWNESKVCKDTGKPPEAPFETPYVVRLHNVTIIDTAQPLFYFHHPNRGTIDNSRYGFREFTASEDGVLHGFAGYFDCVLYNDVTLSIVPETHSPGMFSWFPIYFPIREPVYLRKGEKLVVHFWRMCDNKNVWYEWCVTSPTPGPVHNPKGRSYTIGL